MSSYLQTHDLTIKRLVTTQDAVGGLAGTYTTTARGSLPTSVKGRPVVMTPREKNEHGVRGEVWGWRIMTETDPQIDLNDRVYFDLVSGDSRVVKVKVGSRPRFTVGNNIKHYTTIGEEDSTET